MISLADVFLFVYNFYLLIAKLWYNQTKLRRSVGLLQILSNSKCNVEALSPMGSSFSGELEIFSLSQNIIISFDGWNPLIWQHDGENFFAGLPSRAPIGEEIIVMAKRLLGDVICKKFSGDEIIDWKDFFEDVKHRFLGEREFITDME